MDKKTGGLVATLATLFLCGFPGLCLCIFGGVTAAGMMPYETTVNGVSNSGMMASSTGFAMLCVALIFILIPVAVGFFTLRNKGDDDGVIDAVPVAPSAPAPAPYSDDEPLPPTS